MRIAPGGEVIATVPALIAAVAVVAGAWPIAAIGLILAVAVLTFYRDPERTPTGAGILAPADGVVHEVDTVDGRVHLAIFLNLHNVHVVRAPADGVITRLERVDGHRLPAFLGGAAENAGIRVETDSWTTTMRTGFLARRVRAYRATGDDVHRGERLGHIAFGSRVDVALPAGIDRDHLRVETGDRIIAGETVIAADDPQ